MSEQATYIGMDLGSYKTSVACNNGRRDVLYTAIGWPKDHVARAMLGRDVVFGEDVVEQRLALDVVRPFARGVLKYNSYSDLGLSLDQAERHKEGARLLVEYAVSRMEPTAGLPVYGVIGAPSRASIANKQVIMEAAQDAFDAVLIVPEPFTIAYGMNRLTETVVIDIGAGTIDICPMYGRYPADEDQITIPIGGDNIDERFRDLMRDTYPQAKLSEKMARDIKEKYGFVHDANERVIVTLPTDGQPQELDITEPLKEACMTVVGPIIEALNELVSSLDPEFKQSLLNHVVLGGGGSQLKGLDRAIEQSLKDHGGGDVTKVFDSVFSGAVGALKLAMGTPLDYWNKLSAPVHEQEPIAA